MSIICHHHFNQIDCAWWASVKCQQQPHNTKRNKTKSNTNNNKNQLWYVELLRRDVFDKWTPSFCHSLSLSLTPRRSVREARLAKDKYPGSTLVCLLETSGTHTHSCFRRKKFLTCPHQYTHSTRPEVVGGGWPKLNKNNNISKQELQALYDQTRLWARSTLRQLPRALYVFRVLLIPGILQFTMIITLHCALHHKIEPRHPSLKVFNSKQKGCKSEREQTSGTPLSYRNNTTRCRTWSYEITTRATTRGNSSIYKMMSTTANQTAGHHNHQAMTCTARFTWFSISRQNVQRRKPCSSVCSPVLFSVNDPSAGSPTETLLRLLLPLSTDVC